jgi:hypothetical protein
MVSDKSSKYIYFILVFPEKYKYGNDQNLWGRVANFQESRNFINLLNILYKDGALSFVAIRI